MKKLLVLLTLMALLVVAVPAAAGGKTLLGEQINVRTSEPPTYPAGEAFHIIHGWTEDENITPFPVGLFGFTLDVDDIPRAMDFKLVTIVEPGLIRVQWAHNFPEGLSSGTHTFTGHWWAPCRILGGDCDSPGQVIEAWTNTITVEFVAE
jgi:hypothetical protein